MTGEIQILNLVILLTLSSSRSIVILLTLASQNRPDLFLPTFTVILLSLSKTLGCKNNSNTLWQKIQEPRIVSGTSHFQ